jgi:predicted Zn-dependent protease
VSTARTKQPAALLAAGLFGLFGFSSGARTWVVDLGQQTGVVEGVPAPTERGVAAYRAGDVATAERELADAARTYPRSAVAPLYLARLRLDAGDDYRAGEQLAEALRREPASPLVRQAVAEYGCAMLGRDAANARAGQLVARVGARCAGAADAPGAPSPLPAAP